MKTVAWHDAMRTRIDRRSAAAGILSALGATGVALGAIPAAGEARDRTDTTSDRSSRRRDDVPLPTHADLPYVADGTPDQVLDLYLPAAPASSPSPLVVWIHGGGWVGGSKRHVGLPFLLDDGYAIASIEYRLLDVADPPAQIQDANAAMSFLWEEADRFDLDRERFVLGGSSAGGFSTIVAGLSANNGVPEFNTDPEVRLAALINFFGTVILDTWEPNHPLQGFPNMTEQERQQMHALLNPLQYVDAGDPPVLIIHGELDTIVPIEGSERLTAELELAGVPVTFERYPDRGHGLEHFQDAHTREVVRTFLADVMP